MKALVGILSITCVALVILLVFKPHENFGEPEAPEIDRSGITLFYNEIDEALNYPQILSAKIISESSDKIIFNITYYYPEQTEGETYNLSVHPDTGDWAYSGNEIFIGSRTIPITVSLRIKEAGRTLSESTVMYFYVNHYRDNKYIGKVFDQVVPFEKIWKKKGY